LTVWQAIVLGIVQGATEFLPISSSAHLILVPRLFGWSDQGLGFDVALHAGTLTALLVYFRRDLLDLRRSALWVPVAVGTAPVVAAGLLLHAWVASAARDPRLIAVTLVVFGLLLGIADRLGRRARGVETIGWLDGLLIGSAQAIALVPGVSRSGVTLTAGLGLGLDRRAAARFSFLLAIPATALAAAKEGLDVLSGEPIGVGPPVLGAGFLAAALSGFLVVGWLLRWLERRGVLGFVVYRLVLGAALWWSFGGS
jgi:undecaprenyl-diphosphatase